MASKNNPLNSYSRFFADREKGEKKYTEFSFTDEDLALDDDVAKKYNLPELSRSKFAKPKADESKKSKIGRFLRGDDAPKGGVLGKLRDIGEAVASPFYKVGNEIIALGQLLQPTRASIAERQAQAARTLSPGGGLGSQGGVLSGNELRRGGLTLEDYKKIVGTGAEIGSNLIGPAAGLAAKGSVAARAVTGAKYGAAAGGVGAAGGQLADEGRITPGRVFEGAVAGGILGAAAPAITGGVRALRNRGRTEANAILDESRMLPAQAGRGADVITDEDRLLGPGAIDPNLAVRVAQPVGTDVLKRLADVERRITRAQQKGGISSAEARNLMRERATLIQQIRTGGTKEAEQALAQTDDVMRTAQANVITDVSPTAPRRTGEPTTRTQQFTDTLQRQLVEQIESSPEYKTNLAQRQAVEETYRLAAERGPIDLFNAKPGGSVNAVDVARARASLEPYLNDVNRLISEGADPKTVQKAIDDATKALHGYHNITSEPGRALQIQSTFSKQSLDYLKRLNDYYQTTGGRLTAKQADEMRRMLTEMAETANKLPNRLKERAEAILRGAEEFATAAKVSSPVTHLRNIVGNTLTFVQRSLEKVPATALGAIRGQTSIGELRYIFGTTAGWQSAAKKFVSIMNDALRLRVSANEASRLAREGYKEYIPGKAGALVRIPFKILEATDEFGKAILRDSKLHSEAYALAYREGLRGAKLKQRIAELIEKPTEDMIKAAEREALEYTFQSELGKYGKIAQAIQSTPGGKFFLPFVVTPTNIMKFYAQRSPLGLLSPRNLGDIISKDVRAQNEAIARIVTGSLFSAAAVGAVFTNPDRFTGAAPTNPTERDIFYASGKRPYSIKIGNRWISYQNFQPVGMYLLAAVSLKEAIEKNREKEATDIAATMVGVAAKGLLELPFIQGMNNVLEVLNDPDRHAQRAAQRLLTGFVPNIVRDIRLFGDEIVRAPQGYKDAVADMLPGLSKGVDPRIDIFGEPITYEGSPLERSFLRFGGVTETNLDRARLALDQVGRETGYYPGLPGRRVGGKTLSDDEYRRYLELSGRYFKELVESRVNVLTSDYITPEAKQKLVEDAVRRSRERARRELRLSKD